MKRTDVKNKVCYNSHKFRSDTVVLHLNPPSDISIFVYFRLYQQKLKGQISIMLYTCKVNLVMSTVC